MEDHYLELTKTDYKILTSYKSVVEGLGNYLGEGYEIILHSLEDLHHSVITIVNGHYSGRKIGAPITDFALSMLAKIEQSFDNSDITYFNKNAKGTILKSSTIPITGENNRIIGLICINFYTDTPLSTLISKFQFSQPESGRSLEHTENFTEDIDELITAALTEAKTTVMRDNSISTQNKNKEIVLTLYHKGIFNLKDSVIKVADLLNISKNTVYMHLRNYKNY